MANNTPRSRPIAVLLNIPRWLVFVIGALVVVAVPVVIRLFVPPPELQETARFANLTISSLSSADVELKIEAHELDAQRLTGTVHVILRPGKFPEKVWEIITDTQKIQLFLMHKPKPDEIEPGRPESTRYVVGGSTAQVALAELPNQTLSGNESFWWSVDTLRSEFWYPFDQYKVAASAHLGVQDKTTKTTMLFDIGRLRINMTVSGLYMAVSQTKKADLSADDFEIVLERSLLIRAVALLVGGMALFFVFYVIVLAKIETLVGQTLALFASLWAIRATLRADISSSSLILIDYVTIAIYGVVGVAIVILWWQDHERPKTICLKCKMEINRDAERCPYCTEKVERTPKTENKANQTNRADKNP